jgi:hypothetical protein
MKYTNMVSSPFNVRPSNARAKLITELSSLLWDETKPKGQEAIPEGQWEAILTEPCHGDKQLIAEVCANERWLRGRGSDLMQFFVPFDRADYERIITPFMSVRGYPLHLLWGGNDFGWLPEEKWDQMLAGWVPPWEGAKERLKHLARILREDRQRRMLRFKLPVTGVFGP